MNNTVNCFLKQITRGKDKTHEDNLTGYLLNELTDNTNNKLKCKSSSHNNLKYDTECSSKL